MSTVTLQRMTPQDAPETIDLITRQYGFERSEVEQWVNTLHFDWPLSVKALDCNGQTIGMLNMSAYRIEEEAEDMVAEAPELLNALNRFKYTSVFSFIVAPQWRGTTLNHVMLSFIEKELRHYDFIFVPVMRTLSTQKYWQRRGAILFYSDSFCEYYLIPHNKEVIETLKEHAILENAKVLRDTQPLQNRNTQQSSTLPEQIGAALAQRSLTLATAESCTSGAVAAAITSISGSSAYFKGGIVAYSNSAKHQLLNVRNETLEHYGAVSQATAEQMAIGAKERLESDCAIATTGIAGPAGGTPSKPVGTVWIAASTPRTTICKLLQLNGSRSEITYQATQEAMQLLLSTLEMEENL